MRYSHSQSSSLTVLFYSKCLTLFENLYTEFKPLCFCDNFLKFDSLKLYNLKCSISKNVMMLPIKSYLPHGKSPVLDDNKWTKVLEQKYQLWTVYIHNSEMYKLI